jgi:hypothetical protein
MNSDIDNSERGGFFNECLRDYADAMTALATFQSWAAGRCEAALKRSENGLVCFAVEKPAAYSAAHRPEKPLLAGREFRCGTQANSRGKDGPNVACWLLWQRRPIEEGFRHGVEVYIWLRNLEKARDLYEKIQTANEHSEFRSSWEIDNLFGGPTFRRYPESLTVASVEGHLSQLLGDASTLLKGIDGIWAALNPG